jgi:hypothetical protein
MRAVYHYFNPQASPRLRLMEDVVTTICQDLKRDKNAEKQADILCRNKYNNKDNWIIFEK